MNRAQHLIPALVIPALIVACCLTAVSELRAASVYWDPTGTLSSNGAGNGTWNTNSTAAWWITGGTANKPWTDVTGVDNAIFGAPSGTYAVTVSGSNAANG